MSLYINELNDICKSIAKGTGLTPYEVLRIGRSAYYRYKKYQIPKKKKGEFRTVAQPAKEVKLLQRWVVEHLLSDLPIHECATAYKKGASIKKNAHAHKNNPYSIKLDFKNFFPSITPHDFVSHFKKYSEIELTNEELEFITRIMFWKESRSSSLKLMIGAPSSPLVSNTIMFDFDKEVYSFCNKNGMNYTRYADDICISSKTKNTREAYVFITELLNAIDYPNIELNHEKTLSLSKAGTRRITGVIINNNNELSLGRARKRKISSIVHHYANNKLSKEEIYTAKGLLAFAKDIEPSFIERLIIKYGEGVIQELLPINSDE